MEGRDWTYTSHGEDVVVLAGDICSRTPPGKQRRNRLLESIKVPVVYIPGNHEYYHGYDTRAAVYEQMVEEMSKYEHVHFMDDSFCVISGVRFIGSTLWTEFELIPERMTRDQLYAALPLAIADFSFMAGRDHHPVTGAEMAEWGSYSKTYINWLLREDPATPTVVVTHFMPSTKSIAKRFAGDTLNCYFCSPCEHLFRQPVKMWIHGHTHDACQYTLNDIPVICNPKGYHNEMSNYDSDLVADLEIEHVEEDDA